MDSKNIRYIGAIRLHGSQTIVDYHNHSQNQTARTNLKSCLINVITSDEMQTQSERCTVIDGDIGAVHAAFDPALIYVGKNNNSF